MPRTWKLRRLVELTRQKVHCISRTPKYANLSMPGTTEEGDPVESTITEVMDELLMDPIDSY